MHHRDQFEKLPHKIKIFVPGNHDIGFETHENLYRKMFKNTHVLIDESIIINGIKIYGSPWQPEFYDWAFNLPRGPKLKQKWDLIPEDTDILITHGPPKRILDQAPDGFYCGCEELLEAVKRIEPTYHIFGHIHAGYGIETIGNTTFVNASSCTEQYKPINLPITLSI